MMMLYDDVMMYVVVCIASKTVMAKATLLPITFELNSRSVVTTYSHVIRSID